MPTHPSSHLIPKKVSRKKEKVSPKGNHNRYTLPISDRLHVYFFSHHTIPSHISLPLKIFSLVCARRKKKGTPLPRKRDDIKVKPFVPPKLKKAGKKKVENARKYTCVISHINPATPNYASANCPNSRTRAANPKSYAICCCNARDAIYRA